MGESEIKKAPDVLGQELTSREMQVAKMISIGMSNRDISSELRISIKTVDSHRAKVMEKIGLANNVKLARHALREGWVSLESDLFTVE